MLEATPFTSKGVATELSSFREIYIRYLKYGASYVQGIMTSVCIRGSGESIVRFRNLAKFLDECLEQEISTVVGR